MSGYRQHFQMSLSFMLFLLIIGGPLLGVIVPRLVRQPRPSGPNYSAPPARDLLFVIDGSNSGCVDDDSEPPWESDNIESVERQPPPSDR